MCFTIPKFKFVSKTAKDDIVCYKKVQASSLTVFYSSIIGYKYEKEKLYIESQFKTTRKPFDFYGRHIEKGYHSWSNKCVVFDYLIRQLSEIQNVLVYSGVTVFVKCIIPKGSRYWYNSKKEQYCSNQIIIKEILTTENF